MKKMTVKLMFRFSLCFSLVCSLDQALSMRSAFVSPLDVDQKSVLCLASANISIHFRKSSHEINDDQVKKKCNDGLSILNSLRARLALDKRITLEILRLLNSENIPKEMKDFVKDEQDLLTRFAKSWNASYSTDDLEKLALVSSVSLSWDQTMKILRKISPGKGVIYDYSFETAVFVMFLAPEYPGVFFWLCHPTVYNEEINFYKVCLASALKKCMETITGKQICVAGRDAPGKSIVENICLGCLEMVSKNSKDKKE